MIIAYNKTLACLIPEQVKEEVKVVAGVRSPVHKTGLTKLEVKYGNADIPAGSSIYVSTSQARNQKWSSEIYDFNGDRLWMVPEQVVMLVEKV